MISFSSLRPLFLCALPLALVGCSTVPEPPKPIRIIPASDPIPLNGELMDLIDASGRFELAIEREFRENFPTGRRQRATLVVSSASIDQRGLHTLELMQQTVLKSVASVLVVEPVGETSGHLRALLEGLPKEVPYYVFNEADSSSLLEDAFRRVDMILWDVPTSGLRGTPELAALEGAMLTSTIRNIPIIVYDRPPIAPSVIPDGPIPDTDRLTGTVPLPYVHGFTAAEMARLLNGPYGYQAPLRIVPMNNWSRSAGNSWMVASPAFDIPSKGRAVRQELTDSGIYAPDAMMLEAIRSHLSPSQREASSVTVQNGVARLVIQTEVPPSEIVQKTEAQNSSVLKFDVLAANAEIGSAEKLSVEIIPEALVRPIEVSLLLRLLLVDSPRVYLSEADDSPYGARIVLQTASRGLGAEQVRRRWAAAPSFSQFTEQRTKALIYEP